jgi:nitroreductase
LISVQDPDRRAEVAHLCGDQKQVVGAAWFFAFVADLWRLEESSAKAGDRPNGVDAIEMYTVAAIDAALAAERMVVAAEACGLGTCYIGGLRNHQPEVSRLLNLPRRTAPLFGLCLGVPAPEARSDIKPRLAAHAIWFRESYDPDPDVAEYEGRMREFYAAQGMNPDVGWAKRNGRRASDEGMSGRERMREFLDDQGLATR